MPNPDKVYTSDGREIGTFVCINRISIFFYKQPEDFDTLRDMDRYSALCVMNDRGKKKYTTAIRLRRNIEIYCHETSSSIHDAAGNPISMDDFYSKRTNPRPRRQPAVMTGIAG